MSKVCFGTVGKEIGLLNDFVRVPENYGEREYYKRKDISEIRKLVFRILDRINISPKGKQVFVKPSLVAPYAPDLFEQVPATTDPRVFDPVLDWISSKDPEKIVVGESPAIGYSARFVFRETGFDRICRRYGAKAVYLDEDRVHEVHVRDAKVQKRFFLPASFMDIKNSGGLYISVPKLKNNVFTKVTLSIKNNMGLLQGRTRMKYHNHQISDKLLDLLLVANPDLILVDGIVAGHGQGCTLPRIKEAGVLLGGKNEFSVDAAACRLLGVKPDSLDIFIKAKKRKMLRGGRPKIEAIGKSKLKRISGIVPAEADTQKDDLQEQFPWVKIFAGYPKGGKNSQHKDIGGNTAMIRHALFDYFSEEGLCGVQLNVIYGPGDRYLGKTFYYDSKGQPWSAEKLAKLKGNKIVVGSDILSDQALVCRESPPPPLLLHMLMHKATKTKCRVTFHPGGRHIEHFIHSYTRNFFLNSILSKTIRVLKSLAGHRFEETDYEWRNTQIRGEYMDLGEPKKLRVHERLKTAVREYAEVGRLAHAAYFH